MSVPRIPRTPRTPGGPGTEERLREALEALAGGVHAAPDAYRTARGGWLRRERRRRLVLAVLVTVVFLLATLTGLWVLNQAPSRQGPIFNGTPGTADTAGTAAVPDGPHRGAAGPGGAP
ncbi:hypothetical protein [Streptomyces sp. DH37]|uniref:hypothetical protein n=1 Tax=Streptomyces sp. DH37 TaxID=3040122 RepID=UPI0024414998|nr:hypothetical protein [Streptomyces sp. DH37]MDG9703547.1 hypothetical protein [Streptomyces sp. DH37]